MKVGSGQYTVDVLQPKTQVNLTYPADNWGAAKSGRGLKERATYIVPFESYMTNTGDFLQGCKGKWKVGKGDPNEIPMPSRRVGWGIVVCGRENRPHDG